MIWDSFSWNVRSVLLVRAAAGRGEVNISPPTRRDQGFQVSDNAVQGEETTVFFPLLYVIHIFIFCYLDLSLANYDSRC